MMRSASTRVSATITNNDQGAAYDACEGSAIARLGGTDIELVERSIGGGMLVCTFRREWESPENEQR